MEIKESIFKAYDIRGVFPEEINEDIAYRIGRSFVSFLKAKNIAVGRDMRVSSPALAKSFIKGVVDQGCNVTDFGMVGTDMLYVGVAMYGYEGGVIITASHNPKEYNGMKLVRERAIPLSGETGIQDIKKMVVENNFAEPEKKGNLYNRDIWADYVKHTLGFVDSSKIKPFKIVMDAGNGMSGKMIPPVFEKLPVTIIPMYFDVDGTFPNHEANPLIEENRVEIMKRVVEENADLGIAFDGDVDRCFFIDDQGEFVSGDFVTALLAEAILRKHHGESILYDLRASWAVRDKVLENGGKPFMNRVGHAFFKERMRKEKAIFGGEVTGHYYFRDNYNADSGIIPALLMLELLSTKEAKLSQLIKPLKEKYFISGEINSKVRDTQGKIKELAERYNDAQISYLDGISVDYDDWHFNVRPSNTEPLLRLNLEAKTKEMMEQKKNEVLAIIKH
ncbi:MAG: phosphomannomutase/phosphoglucomutase [Candidatus Aureabacteria bacterium]|nr:phosphomannomutase/phosphoglucomutase [Candidatus Auribacterota bacterium]